jgi:hypothetical protein
MNNIDDMLIKKKRVPTSAMLYEAGIGIKIRHLQPHVLA